MPITMLPMLATIDMQLTICEGDVKMVTWLGLDMLLLMLEMITPGMARNPTFAVSITVD